MRSLFFMKLILFLFSTSVFAANPTFKDLSKDDFEGVVEDFSAVFMHTSVSPASSLGRIFGFEVGLIAGAAQTPTVKDLGNEAAPGSDVSMLPNIGVLAAVSLPAGFGVEAVVLPETKFSDVTVGSTAIAVKWTFTDVVPLPLDLAVKAHMTDSTMEFKSKVDAVDTEFDFEGQSSGVLLQGSKKWTILEPYFGVGMVKSKGKMKVVGSTDVFDSSYSTTQSAEEELTGGHFMVGVNFNLIVLKLGFEASRVFEANKAAAKISFYF